MTYFLSQIAHFHYHFFYDPQFVFQASAVSKNFLLLSVNLFVSYRPDICPRTIVDIVGFLFFESIAVGAFLGPPIALILGFSLVIRLKEWTVRLVIPNYTSVKSVDREIAGVPNPYPNPYPSVDRDCWCSLST